MRKSLFTKYYKYILAFLGFLSVFLIFLKPPVDPDLFWHLKNGEIIIEQRRFPLEDEFSHTLPGYRWADSYWLSEAFLYLGIKTMGLLGLVLVFTLMATFALFLQLRAIRLLSISLLFIAAVSVSPMVGIRPQVISLLFFSLQWWLIRKHFFSGLPVLFLFWANLHAGFFLGLIFLWVFFLFKGTLYFFELERLERLSLKRLFFTSLVSTLVTIINPYGFNLHQTIFRDIASEQIKTRILEWQPVNFQTQLGLVFLVLVTLLLLGWLLNRENVLKTEKFIIGLAIFASLLAVRNIPLSVILILPSLVKNYGLLLNKNKMRLRYFRYWALLFFAFFPFAYLFDIAPRVYETSLNEKKLAEVGNYPYRAVTFLKKNPQRGKVFNAYGWGGYLILNLEGTKVFIDGRMPGWETLFADYLGIYYLTQDFEEIFERFEISWVLVEKQAPIAHALKVHPEWKLIYEDEISVIYTQK